MSRILRFLTCVSLGFAGAALAAPPEWITKTVGLKVNPGKGEVRADEGNQGCQRGKSPAAERKGCVRFETDKIGTLTVTLKHGPNTGEAEGCSDPGVGWVITKIELTHEGYSLSSGSSTVPSEKGIFGASVPPWLKQAFPGTADNGVVYSAAPEIATDSASIVNLNNHDASGGSKDVWYRVTVTSCKDYGISLQSDPRIENDGTTL